MEIIPMRYVAVLIAGGVGAGLGYALSYATKRKKIASGQDPST